jgi:tetratricopeptide (TPR) repeat protein
LKYIADRLNRPITYFLEESSDQESYFSDSDSVSENLKEQIRRINEFIEAGRLNEAQKEAEDLLTGSLQNNISKLAADIILKLGIAMFNESNLEETQKYLKHSIQMYIKGAFLLEASKAYVVLAKTYYQKSDYSKCLAIADKVVVLYNKSISKDPLFEIELYYNKIIVLFAIGDMKQTADIIQTALALSEKSSVYYKTDDIYRLSAVFHYLLNSKEAFEQNIEKALQFADLTNDKDCLARIYALKGMAAVESNKAEEALVYAEKNKHYFGREIYIYHFIKARAFFILENYEQAYKSIKNVDYPSYETHKFDYLNMWSAKVYEGLILNKLGKNPDAVDAIKIGIDKMSVVGDSKFLVFANKSISQIYSSMNDYQNAFLYLKNANEIQDRINEDAGLIF